jgi:hypothetical protein
MKEKSLNLQPLNMVEMYAVNGGNCPTTWYTNDATINANGKNMDSYFQGQRIKIRNTYSVKNLISTSFK